MIYKICVKKVVNYSCCFIYFMKRVYVKIINKTNIAGYIKKNSEIPNLKMNKNISNKMKKM